MASCLHPAFAKRAVRDPAGGGLELDELTGETMVEAATGPKPFGPDLDIRVLAIDDDVASVSVRSEPYLDLLHLARFGDRWLLVNALREDAPSSPPTERSDAGLGQALADYATFVPARDVERARRCHHPDLRERRADPNSSGLDLEETTLDEVLAIAAEGFGEEPPSWEATTAVLHRTATVASVRMDVAWFLIHLHLAAFADGWRIVNILYRTKEDV
jgi:hypothetical protein